MVRAKFRLQEVTARASFGKQKKLVFSPIYDTSIPEDQRFSEATPTGRLEMEANNEAALAQLELGQDYYLDLTPAPAPA